MYQSSRRYRKNIGHKPPILLKGQAILYIHSTAALLSDKLGVKRVNKISFDLCVEIHVCSKYWQLYSRYNCFFQLLLKIVGQIAQMGTFGVLHLTMKIER